MDIGSSFLYSSLKNDWQKQNSEDVKSVLSPQGMFFVSFPYFYLYIN